jgi:ASPIC and UnbV/FG-GAP-like repeat
MFIDRSELIKENFSQLHYGVAVVDVDNDGEFELFVAGYGAANRVLKWNGTALIDIADPTLADVERQAIGVAAADLDGDGREEIYVLNTDVYAGRKRFGDRLFDFQSSEYSRLGGWVDLFSLPQNADSLNLTAGRSVLGLDRYGHGRYGFFVANYGGPMRLYELDQDGFLADCAPKANLALVTGGRGAIAAPLVSKALDIFAVNEQGANFLFQHQGDGTFENVAALWGLADEEHDGRGVSLFDEEGEFGIVYGNWQGPHRLMRRGVDYYTDNAPVELAQPSRIRTVIAADFDNDGELEIFFNNLGEPNRLFGWRSGAWIALPMGDALEPFGLGTGAAIGDFDGDGRLELLISHGEAAPQPLSFFQTADQNNHWLRILPLTPQGAPARGATVTLKANGRIYYRIIDCGSGYLCQMEPVAHFGLGKGTVIESVRVRWLDGTLLLMENPQVDQLLRIPYPVAP